MNTFNLVVIALVFSFLFIFFITKNLEQYIAKLERQIAEYLSKKKELDKLIKLIENKNIDSLDNIFIEYKPIDKECFIKLKNKCSKNNEENIYPFLEEWVEKEKQSLENILNHLSLEVNKIKKKLIIKKNKQE